MTAGRGFFPLLFTAAAVIAPGMTSFPRAEPLLPPVIISEIMFNPDGDENAREFVELANTTDRDVSIEGFRIGDGAAFDAVIPASGGGWTIPARGFAVVFDPDYFTAGAPYANLPSGTVLFTVPDKAIGLRGFSNSAPETVYLVSAAGDTLSKVGYSADCPAGYSWERILPGGGDGMDNFKPSRAKEGTPGGPNSVTPPAVNPALDKNSLRFDPASPAMGGRGELVVTVRNGGLESFRDARVTTTMVPGSSLGTVVFDENVLPGGVSSERRIPIQTLPGGRVAFIAAAAPVNAPSLADDDTARIVIDIPVPPGTVVLNELMAAPREGPEWIELLNTGDSAVSLSGWRMGDAAGHRSDAFGEDASVSPDGFAVISGGEIPALLPSGGTFVRAARFPPLDDGGDTVRLFDQSGAPVDSLVYPSTTRGTSIELIAPRLRGGSHAWDFAVDPSGSTPGRVNSIRFDGGATPSSGGTAVLTVTPNPFLETAVIGYDLAFPLARVRIEVFDRSGRKVAVLRDAAESGSRGEVEWDGRSGGRHLPAGAYILSFEALNKLTGAMITVRKPIIVARKL